VCVLLNSPHPRRRRSISTRRPLLRLPTRPAREAPARVRWCQRPEREVAAPITPKLAGLVPLYALWGILGRKMTALARRLFFLIGVAEGPRFRPMARPWRLPRASLSRTSGYGNWRRARKSGGRAVAADQHKLLGKLLFYGLPIPGRQLAGGAHFGRHRVPVLSHGLFNGRQCPWPLKRLEQSRGKRKPCGRAFAHFFRRYSLRRGFGIASGA
jgi:hypothetical protein